LAIASRVGGGVTGWSFFLRSCGQRWQRWQLARYGAHLGTSRGEDVPLAQRQHAALEHRQAASPQVLVDHPQVYIIHRTEVRVLYGLKRQPVLLADGVAVMAVDEDLAPQHQRIAAALG
jgi:hypothetical protein